jgi:hypothetical protein
MQVARSVTTLTVDQGIGLAEHVIAGDARAINRPKALLELASLVLGLLVALERPDLIHKGDI